MHACHFYFFTCHFEQIGRASPMHWCYNTVSSLNMHLIDWKLILDILPDKQDLQLVGKHQEKSGKLNFL